ncbi:MAG: lipid kinase [Marinilabiliales bacterium]|nr:MAG: lipid kinase [Marinilabiliales bacterium]
MKEKFLFVVNPISGNKPKEFITKLIDEKFNEDSYNTKIIFTSFAGEATHIAKQYLKKGYNHVVAVGGDGTVNEVASAIVETDAILGIIPFGSGNGLARHLKIPLRPDKALKLIKSGNHKRIDYGKINDQKFFCTTGVGFDAHIGHLFDKMEGRGFSNYVKATVSAFRKYKPKRYEISMNGTTIMRDAFLITFANASQYGNNAHIAPKADIQDGKLEVVIMRSFPLITAPGIGARLFLKNIHKSIYMETYQCKSIIVKRKSPDAVHYDGEPGEMGEILNIKVIHEGLNVFAH